MANYSLKDPLPSDIFANVAGQYGGYRAYPTYSVPWFWRRSAVFVPFVSAVGLFQAALLGTQLGDLRIGLLCIVVGVPIWILIATAGPALATYVRHLQMPLARERIAVVVAILVGVVISCGGQYLAGLFSRAEISPRYSALFSGPAVQRFRETAPAVVAIVWGCDATLFFLLGGGLALRTYFREQRSWEHAQHAKEMQRLRREKSEADLRLTVLQAQVEPHFLFNTLASVHSLIRTDPERAEATIEALVDHLRASMPRFRAEIGSTHSTLAQQIDVCASYLAVMKVRLGHRLRYSVDVAESLRNHDFPPLLLISLVENAIKHGIEPSPSGGNIVISAAVEVHGDIRQLAVSVSDDGVGLRPGPSGGLGLNNVREQLATRFGLQGALTIRGRTVGGVTATIRVPHQDQRIASEATV
ncbi:MAG TPA: histidine kinase [Steroidobacteraceae bacterium]|jgi:sensor histidine kinase YesM